MKTLYNFIKRSFEKKTVRYIFYFLLAFSAALFHDLTNQDEVWNFNFAHCMSNGLLPYRDFNLLQTPFSCFLNSIALSLFGQHLIVVRFTGVLMFTAVSVQAEKICLELGKQGAVVMTGSLMFLCMFFWNVFLEYSTFIVFCTFFSLKNDLSIYNGHRENSIKLQLTVGIVMGLGMLCKQTTGTFMAASSWIACAVVSFITGTDKTQGRAAYAAKNVFFRMLGSSIPCFIFLFYLLGTGTFDDFWDMCYLGIFTFSSSYPYITFMKENPAYFLLGVLIPLLMVAAIVVMIAFRRQSKGKQTLILFVYAAFSCLHMIPLANAYHVALTFMSVMFIVLTVFPDGFYNLKFIRILSGMFAVGAAVFMFLIYPLTDIACSGEWVTDIKGLELTIAPKEDQQNMKEIISYVDEKNKEGHTVYILDNFAPLYFLPSNQYHKYLDMFLEGNIGTITPKEVLESTEKGSIFLLPDRERNNYQMPRRVEEEYMETLTNFGRICDYTIYIK